MNQKEKPKNRRKKRNILFITFADIEAYSLVLL